MSVHDQPLVSVVTPVYNGAQYLRECIESVVAQSYSNWEYTIVNNCSTDGTLAIAEEYATMDQRIRVCSNDKLLDIIANHNRAFRLISPSSKYCKVVSADDWLLPECIMRMVDLAESQPSIGLVGSYQLSGGGGKWYVRTDGLPYQRTVISGREICRLHFLTALDVFGNPTSNLYRADIVREAKEFYPNPTAEADISACFKSLRHSDFGFVHQVLSYERLHNVRVTKTSETLNAYLSSEVGDLLEYGPFYLTPEELSTRLREMMDDYYRYLALSVVNCRNRTFWKYHSNRLEALGYPLDGVRLGKAVGIKVLDLLLNPKRTVEALVTRVKARPHLS